MPSFRVFDEDRKQCCSCPGSEVHILYESRLGKDGNLELFEAGKQNVREFIQASADSCDIHKIVARYNAGDVSALNRRQNPVFADFTGLGTDIISTLNNIDLSKRQFEALPLAEREKFGNSHAVWLQSMVTGVSPDIGNVPDSNVVSAAETVAVDTGVTQVNAEVGEKNE